MKNWKRNIEKTLDPNRKNIVFHRKIGLNRVGIGPLGIKKIADEPGKRGEHFARSGSGWIDDFSAIFREKLSENFARVAHASLYRYVAWAPFKGRRASRSVYNWCPWREKVKWNAGPRRKLQKRQKLKIPRIFGDSWWSHSGAMHMWLHPDFLI